MKKQTYDLEERLLEYSVRKMRSVFSHMEAEQSKLLKKLGMSPFDIRLRSAREEAKDVFERTWSLANS
ncbi:MAG: hypothetical protein ABIJ44_00675, partial [Pseudomonadota bacterium]